MSKLKISNFKVFIIFGIAAIIGFSLISMLSVRLNPSQNLPSLSVSYSWSGASPLVLEKQVTSVLEAGFNTIKGVDRISSKSSKRSGYINLEFDAYTDIDVVRFEVAAILRQLYTKLPEHVSYPIININRSNNERTQAFLSYSIKAPESPSEIQETVKTQIEPVLSALKNIDKTVVYGAMPKEIVMYYDFDMLKRLGISKDMIVSKLEKHFLKKSLGHVFYNDQYISLSIKPNKKFNWHLPISKIDERMMYLDEITTIKEQEQKTQHYYRVNGENAITLSIFAVKNANTITLRNEIESVLTTLQSELPGRYEIIKIYDTTEYLKKELNKIYKRTGYTILILLLFIIVVTRSFNYLIVVVVSLSANLGFAFMLYYIFNVEIQLYSLAGIVISLGIIIDNSIVMIDHLRNHNNKSVFIPILAATLTTVGALTVISFMDEKYKANLIDFALVIIINLSVSLVIALFLIPALLQKFFLIRKTENNKFIRSKKIFYRLYYFIILFLLKFKKPAIVVLILIFGLPLFMLPHQLDHNKTWYQKLYNKTVGNEWYREHIRPEIDTYLGGSFRLFSHYVFEKARYNQNEETKLYVTASMEKGNTIHQMNEAILTIENYLQQYAEIKQYIANIYSGDYGKIEISFKESYANSSFPFLLKNRLIRKALSLGGIDWNIYGVGNGFNNGGSGADQVNFTLHAKGYNYSELNRWADTLKYTLEEHPRIPKVTVRENSYWNRRPSYQYQFNLNKEKLALHRVAPSMVYNDLEAKTLNTTPNLSLNIQGKHMPVRFSSKNAFEIDIWNIKNTPLDSINKPVVLTHVASITKERAEENIDKENQEYIRLVEFQYMGNATFGSRFLDKKLKQLKNRLPIGYSIERSEKQWLLSNDKNNNYSFLLVLVLMIIYLVCSVLFESLKQSFVILSVIPISFIGVFLTFYWFNFNFDQGGLASFVLLSGITVNASIFIITSYNKLRKNNPKQHKILLYIEAFKQKIFPVLITILSTIAGFVPFIIDGQDEVFWFALAVGTIGGLLFSLIGMLFYLPIFTMKSS